MTTPVRRSPAMDRVAVAGDAAALDDRGRRAGARARRGDLLEGRAADEVAGLVELDDPAQAGLERVRRRGRARCRRAACRLEPERVAGARGRPGTPSAPRDRRRAARPTARRVRRRLDEDLEAVLAGVAGPGDQRRDPGDVCPRRSRSSAARRGRRRSAARGPRPSAGPGRRRGRSRASGRRGRPRTRRAARPGRRDTTCGVAGVGDDQEPLVGEPVDDQVVDDPAVRRRRSSSSGRARSPSAGGFVTSGRGEGRRRRPGPRRTARPCATGRTGRPARGRRGAPRGSPLYWTGISQPPNSISRAPSASCALVERASGGSARLERRRSRRGLGRGRGVASAGAGRDAAARRRGRRAPARSRTSASSARLVEVDPADLRRTRGRGGRGRRRSAPSGSSGRSCGCACRAGRTSTRSSRAGR